MHVLHLWYNNIGLDHQTREGTLSCMSFTLMQQQQTPEVSMGVVW